VTDRIGKGVRSSPRDALIADAAGARAGRAFGFHRAMDHAGAVVGPLVAALLVRSGLDIRSVFWVAVIPGAIATVLILFIREKPHSPAAPTATATSKPTPTSTRLPGTLTSYLAILLIFSLGNSSDAFLLLRARDLHLSTAAVPMLWTVFNLVRVVSAYLGGDLSDRVPRTSLILGGWVLYAATYLGFSIATEGWHVWALFVVYGLYYGLTEPAESALVRDLAPASLRGTAYGAYNFVIGVTALPASLLTGWLWKTYSPAIALEAGAALAGLSAILLIAWSAIRAAGRHRDL
jgi:MFS family permease